MARPSFGYRNAAGQKVPGSTTVLKYVQTMDSDILCSWAAKLAKQGLNWRDERSKAGAHGTLLHELCETKLPHPLTEADKPADCTSEEQWTKLKASYATILVWWLKKQPKMLIAEVPLVSEALQFGGTMDACVELDMDDGAGRAPWLLDYKTGGQVGTKECAQMASYRQLLKECKGVEVRGAVLIHAPTKEPGYMRPVVLDSKMLDLGMVIFNAGLAIGAANAVISKHCE